MRHVRTVTDDFKGGDLTTRLATGNPSSQYARAHRILIDGCQVPPSFEVFNHELALARHADPAATPERVARQTSDFYHRTNMGQYRPDEPDFPTLDSY